MSLTYKIIWSFNLIKLHFSQHQYF